MNIRLNIDSLNIRPNIGLNIRKNAIQVKKDFYYSPPAEAGVFSTEIKKTCLDHLIPDRTHKKKRNAKKNNS